MTLGLSWCCMLLLVHLSSSCFLHGTDSGECTVQTMDPVWRSTFMPFCFDAIQYPACIPKYQTLPPTREFPQGRWFNNTVRNKDDWIQESVQTHIAQRVGFERNKTMKNMNRNEYGDVGNTRRRFDRRPDCKLAYKNYFCWINFPRCIVEKDLSLPTCRSACENFFITCNYARGLWRCGKSKWFNGYEPEQPQFGVANITYMREFMTGQPFRENKYTTQGNEVPICTPAILGAASRSSLNDVTFSVMSAVVLSISSLLFMM
jgi:hypothetical protein